MGSSWKNRIGSYHNGIPGIKSSKAAKNKVGVYEIDTFDKNDDGHVKTFQQWVLLGDPSLQMGGFIR